jgi:plastocyanin
MLSGRKAIAACAATATALAVAVPGASGVAANNHKHGNHHHHHGHNAKPKKVSVKDDFFTPSDVSVKKGGKVQWVWASDNFDTHNVVLKKHPKGVKARDYRSGDASVQYKYTAKLNVPGTYTFICTYHPDVMQTTVKVKKH